MNVNRHMLQDSDIDFEKMSTLFRYINVDGAQVIAGLNGNHFFPNGLLKMTMLKISDQIPNFMQVMENFNLMSVRIDLLFFCSFIVYFLITCISLLFNVKIFIDCSRCMSSSVSKQNC
jgi:hypothetical protein